MQRDDVHPAEAMAARIYRSLNAPLAELIDKGVISSPEHLRQVLRQFKFNSQIYYLNRQDRGSLSMGIRAMRNRLGHNPVLCPRCSAPVVAGRLVCPTCSAFLNGIRRLWGWTVGVSAASMGGIGVILTMTLGGFLMSRSFVRPSFLWRP